MDAIARATSAEALGALGRYEEAIATYRSLTDGFLFVDASWLDPSFMRSAQWYEELGDTDFAIDFYGRFVELWENADPHFQFQEEGARARLNELSIRNAAEPRQ